MEEFEKVEKLTQKANVSYEEAREALNACGGDLLDAMIYLEKSGKVDAPKAEPVTTRAEENCLPVLVASSNNEEKKSSESNWKDDLKNGIRTAWQKCCDNEFVISKDNDVKFKLPLHVSILLFILLFHIAIPAMIISLFFGVRYSFVGKDDLSKVNEAFDKVGEAAESVTVKVKEEINKSKEN